MLIYTQVISNLRRPLCYIIFDCVTMLTNLRSFFYAVAAVCTSLSAPLAQSAELGDFYNLGTRPAETAIRVGFVGLNAPRYQGSAEQKTTFVPGVFLHASNGFFADPFNGIGYSFDPAGALNYGVRANLETGRDVETTLPGFEKIKARLNPGVFANYAVNDTLTLKSAARLGVGDGAGGSLLNLGAAYKLYNANYISVNLNASVKYANSSYMQSYFGVTPAQSATSGLKTFQPGAGFSAAQVGLTAGFPISREIYIFSSASVQRLLGDAANSPLAKKKNQVTAFVGSVYSF
jgi:MipA family protein